MENKKYQVVYADPPWKYSFSKSNNRAIENKYDTMTLEEIKTLNIPTADDAVLFLWATAPKLKEALDVMAAWGFSYKTHAIWNKELIGMGYWFRGQHELLLVGTKGHFAPPKPADRIGSVFIKKRTIHSLKPSCVRNLIAKSFPNTLKIELFARQVAEGWDSWGNEVGKFEQTIL